LDASLAEPHRAPAKVCRRREVAWGLTELISSTREISSALLRETLRFA
jgi:hypothetical protein